MINFSTILEAIIRTIIFETELILENPDQRLFRKQIILTSIEAYQKLLIESGITYDEDYHLDALHAIWLRVHHTI